MATAFILINSEIGKENKIINNLKKERLLKETMIIHGTYDIITKLETENMQKISEFITLKIRRTPEISSTLTLIVNDDEPSFD